MASGSRGRGSSRARGGGGAPAPARAAAPDEARFAGLSAADLVGHLIRRNRRASDFVDVALVLAARERRLAEAEARIRAADEAAARLRAEIAARDRCAAATEAQIRRLVAATEARHQAEIHAWQHRAVEAEARLQAHVGWRDHGEVVLAGEDYGQGGLVVAAGIGGAPGGVPMLSSLERATGPALPPPAVLQPEVQDEETEVGPAVRVADLTAGHEAKAQAAAAAAAEEGRREEALASGKRKESVASCGGKGADVDARMTTSLRQRFKKLKLQQGGSSCSIAATRSEANTIDEAEAEDEWEDQDALATVPEGCDLLEASVETGGDVREEGALTEPKHADTNMSVEGDVHVEHDLLQSSPEIVAGGELKIGTEQGTGEDDDDQPEDKSGGEQEGPDEHEPQNLAAPAVVASAGNELQPNEGVEARGGIQQAAGGQEPEAARTAAAYAQGRGDSVGDEPESDKQKGPPAVTHTGASRGVVPEASGKSTVTAENEKLRKKGLIYKMVFKALKEKERKQAASQPNLRCWLYAPLPEDEPVGLEEDPDDGKGALQQ